MIPARPRRGPRPRGLAERFASKVDASGGPDACWPWTAATNGVYGRIKGHGRELIGAHRAALMLAGVHVPPGAPVLHECDNPRCCNPAHLRVGTAAENVADAIARGRHSPPPVMSGPEHGRFRHGRYCKAVRV